MPPTLSGWPMPKRGRDEAVVDGVGGLKTTRMPRAREKDVAV